MIIRIARARFNAIDANDVHVRLRASEATLQPAVAALPGLVRYYVGMDVTSGAMTNTSVWDDLEHANAMSNLSALRQLRPQFTALGLEFQPVVNYEIVWTHPVAPATTRATADR